MTVPLSERYRVALLRGPWRRSPRVFLRLTVLLAADALVRHRELVFRLEAADIPAGIPVMPSDLSLGEVFRWKDLPVSFRQRIEASSGRLDWGSVRWFAKGWRLWVGRSER